MSYATFARRESDAPASRSKVAPSSVSGGLRIGEPNDAYEQEAHRVAEAVMSGRRAPAWSISKVSLGNVQRQTSGDQPAPKPNNYDEAAKKLGEAFLKTDMGKKLTDAVKQDPLVKGAEGFVDTLPGKIIAGAAAVGAVSALAATHTALPAQIPEIPLDSIRPGLSVKITYEGPVDHPTKAAITFSYSPKGEQKKLKQTTSERYRAETARIAAEQEKFRAGMKYKPGSAEDIQQRQEQKAIEDYTLHRFGALPGTGGQPLIPTYPALKGSPDTGLRLPTFESPFKPKPIHVLDQQLELKPLSSSNAPSEAEKKEEPTPIQRKAESAATRVDGAAAPAIVHEVVNSPGQPLDVQARSFFEPSFGRDFSKVKVHTDSQATASAGAVQALAFTHGNHIVFGPGQYSPLTPRGRALLAHELAHVLQQETSKNQTLQRQPVANQPVPAPAPHPSPPRRQDFLFLMGKDRAGNPNKFYTAALRYYKAHLPNATFVTSVRNLTDLLDHLLTHTKGPIGNLYIVSHANEDGTLSFGLEKADANNRLDVVELRNALHPKGGGKTALPDVRGLIDAQTRIHIKGCDIGRTQQMVELVDEVFGGAGTVTAPTHEQGFSFDPSLGSAEAIRVETELIGEFTSKLPSIPPVPPAVDKSLKGAALKAAQQARADEVQARKKAIADRPKLIAAERRRIQPMVSQARELAATVESFSGPMFQRPGITLFTKDELAPQVKKLYAHLSAKKQSDMVTSLTAPDKRGEAASIIGQHGQRVQTRKAFSFSFADPRDAAEANRVFAEQFKKEHFAAKSLVSVEQRGSKQIFKLEGRVTAPHEKARDEKIDMTADFPPDAELIAKAKENVSTPYRYRWRVEVKHKRTGMTTKEVIGERVIAYLHHGSLDPTPHQHFDRPESDPVFFATSTFALPPAKPPAAGGKSAPP